MHYGLHDAQHRRGVDAVRNLIRFLSSAAQITAEDEVLDVGCGFGGSSIWLAQNVGCRVTGIDINPREIESARRQAKKSGVDHLVRFIEMDYREMARLGAATFSVLWQIETLIYADRRKFIADAHRLLRDGGRIAITNYFSRPGAMDPADQRILDRWVRGWAGIDLVTPDEFVACLAGGRLREVRFRDESARVLPSARRMSRVCRLTAPLGRALETVGLRSQLQTENSIGAVLQYDALRRGLWIYGIVSAEKRAASRRIRAAARAPA